MSELWELIKGLWRRLSPCCPSCPKGRVHYSGENYTGRVWISIYQCGVCKKEFI